MKRPLWAAAVMTAGLGVPALAQESPGLGIPPAADAADPADPALGPGTPILDPSLPPETDPPVAPASPPVDLPAAVLPKGTPAVDPAAPAIGGAPPTVDPAEDPSVDSAVPNVPTTRPEAGLPKPGMRAATPGTRVAPIARPVVPAAADPSRPTRPGDDLDAADGQGAPLVPDEEAAPAVPGRPPVVDPLGPGVMPGDPLLPADDPTLPDRPLPGRGVPLDSVRPAPAVDPGYAVPARPRRTARPDVPQVSLDEVVRNPVRIYDARLSALTGDWQGATAATDTLLQRFPNDPRVPYLRYFVFARSGQHDMALDALRSAITLEESYPVGDYGRFLEPFQGPDRFYLERVRRAAGELDSAGSLTVEPAAAAVPPRPAVPPALDAFDPDEPST